VLEIGQTVNVQVLDIDRERQRISLGLKQTQSDPWQHVLDSHQEGDVVEGTVTKVVTFGAFVEILPGVEGLVHISELAQHHVENPREIVSQGDKVKVRIVEVDADRRRLSLSLKGIDGEPLNDIVPNVMVAEEPIADDEVPAAESLEAESLEVEAAEEPAAEDEVAVEVEAEEEPAAEAEVEAAEPAAEAELEPELEPESSEE
jgi:small subunit ribosomal protein S1